MFMFQNGLMATFIPEIIMVIGFVLCLLTPGFKEHNATPELAPVVAHLSTVEHRQATVYHLSAYDFQHATEVASEIRYSIPRIIKKSSEARFESPVSTSDGLSFTDFSRPPPPFRS
jgi:hypothetical protein